ncbi:MAG TPA: serine hydrolase [Thermoanaerobaculia bacterium]|nr:serine hydrolase [Thermoanaerobaculia bacterium]
MNRRVSGVRPVFFALLAGALLALPSRAAGPEPLTDLAGYADHLLASSYASGSPGAAILVVKDGKVVLRKGFGTANLELGIPVAPDMVFEIGSITKQFTAASILLLQERGRLRVEDEITKYLPDFPTHGQKITLENLLTHTSGIPSYTGLPEWYPHIREDLTLDALIALFKDKPLEFTPGEKWAYDNSGYVLLGAIIEKVSGKSYERFVEEEIFQKLGMTHSRYGHPEEIIPRRASGYSKGESGYRNADFVSMTQPYAAGALMSNVDDLLIWGRALESETLLKKTSLDRMLTSATLKSGAATHYGYGMGVFDFEGRRVLLHGGGINGFTTALLRVPSERLFISILTNTDSGDPGPEALAVRILAKALGKPVEERKTIELGPQTLQGYTGVYQFDEETKRTILYEGGKLVAQHGRKQDLAAVARDEFVYPDGMTRLRFRRDAQGKVTGVVMVSAFGPDETGTRTNDPLPQDRQVAKVDPSLYDTYAGTYELMPNFSLVVTREGDRIFTQATGQQKLEIFPESETRFFLKVVDAQLEFVRGADGKVTGLILHQNGHDISGKRK